MRKRLTMGALTAALAVAGWSASSAEAALPGIHNTAGGCPSQTTWLVTCTNGGQTTNGANNARVTVWSNHDLDKSLASILTDDDWDGSAFTTRPVTSTRPTIAGGYPRSRGNLSWTYDTGGTGMSCGPLSFTRRTSDRVLRIQARDSAGQTQSGTTDSAMRFMGNGGCTGAEDFAYLYNVAAGNFDVSLTPGQSDTFNYNGDDPDSGTNEDFEGVAWRLRNLATGVATGETVDCDANGDNAAKSTSVTFPDRGSYVVEAELRNDGDSGCPQNDSDNWYFALGTVDVNSAAAPTADLTSVGAPIVGGVVRPTYGSDWTVRATNFFEPDQNDGAGPGRDDNGGTQIVEWDLDLNTLNGVGGFETNNVEAWQQAWTGTETVDRNVDSSPQTTPGLYTVRARYTDNGAGDAADTIRRTSGADTIQYRVDAAPVANAQSVTTDTNATNVPITLTGTDPDSDTLTYSIVSGPTNGTLTPPGGTGAARTYTPNPGYAGTDSFVFQVNDGFGRTANAVVSINVRPDTTITSPANGASFTTTTVPVSFTSSGSPVTFECKLDAAAFSACTSPNNYTGLSEGSHTVQVRAIATAGAVADPTPASVTFTVDSIAPDTTIDTSPPALSNNANASFTFSSPTPADVDHFECSLDSAPFTTCTSPQSYPGLADGPHTFEVRAEDAATNEDPTPASYAWTIDTTAPDTTIDTGPNPIETVDAATFTFSSPTPGDVDHFECSLDSAPFTTCTSPKNYTTLANGNHTFQVRAHDAAGNFDATPASQTWTVITALPNAMITSGPDDPTNQTSATFTFTPNIPGSTFECSLDNVAFTPCSSPQTYTGLLDGSHHFEVREIDILNRVQSPPTEYDWEIDTVDPVVTIDTFPTNPSADATGDFTFSSNEDPDVDFQCQVDNGGFTPCTSPYATLPLTGGSHTFEVQGTDAAGNTSAPDSYIWVVDAGAPDTTIDTFPPDPSNDTTPEFTFSSNESPVTFECSLDSAPFATCTTPYETAVLGEGNHTFEVRARDGANNVDPTPASYAWEVDLTDPVVEITVAPPALTNSTSAHFEFTVDDPGADVECSLDSAPFADCDSPEDLSSLADGSHTFVVRATDTAGNDGSDSHTWTVDSTPPDTNITANPPNPSNSANASFSFNGSDPGGSGVASFQCQIDGGGFSACTSPQSYTGLTEGSHTFQVRAIDNATNVDATPASYTWVVDTIAPDTNITANPPNPSNSANASFSFNGSDPGGSGVASFQCQIDGGGFSACTSPQSYTGLTEGSHTFQVRAIDNATNVDATPASYTWVVDTIAPDTNITANPPNPSNSAGASFSFNGSDPGGSGVASFQCQIDGGGFSACTSPQSYTGLTEGSHTFQVRAIDNATNVDATPASYTWVVDTIAPDTNITANPPNPSNSANASFSFNGSDPGGSGVASFQCQIDGGGFSACTSPQSYTGLTEGSHTFQVRAIDNASNVDQSPASYTWVIDLTPPQTTIDTSPPNPSNSPNPSFTFSGSDPGGSGVASFQCQIDGGGFSACTSPKSYTGLGEGPHTFQVRAIDNATNVDQSPASYAWFIDLTPPQTTIDSGPDDPTNQVTAEFEFSANEGASLECSLDGAPFTACNPPKSYSGLSEGDHTFRVQATDIAGNTDPTPALYEWTVDLTNPVATIDSAPNDPTNQTTANFQFSADEPVTGFECRIDGGSFVPCTSPKSYPGLTEDSHTFEVRARDLAGNTGATDSHIWTIDTTAPETTIDDGPDDPTNQTSAEFDFSSNEAATLACSLDGAPYTACNPPKSYSGLSQGPHTFSVRATDIAGNPDPTPATYMWNIDTTNPVATINSAPDNPTNETSATFTFTAGEPTHSFECSLDGATFAPCTSPQSYTGLTEASHVFEVRARDTSGNTGTPDSHTWLVDLTDPETTIDNGPPNPSNDTTPEFDFSSNEAGSTFECKVDTGSFGPCTTGFETPTLGEGPHTFEVRATDPAGNTDQTPDTHAWTIDTTDPTVSIDVGPSGSVSSTSAHFEFSTGGTPVSIECDLDGAGYSACTSPQDLTGLGQGPHTFTVKVTDAAGNDATDARIWTVDTVEPDTTIDSGPTDPDSSTTANFTFSSTESPATFECSLDGAPFTLCTSPKSYSGLDDGPHELQVRSIDAADNTDSTPASHQWTVDATAPDTTIDASPPAESLSADAEFEFSSPDGTATFECSLDGATFTPCTSPQPYTGLADGDRNFRVRAVDPAGNPDPTPASFDWDIDTDEPDTTIDTAPPALANSATANFTFSSDEGDASFECQLDTGGWDPCSSPKQLTGLSDTSHTFEVRAIDPAGNTDQTPDSHTWTVDTGTPDTQIDANPLALSDSPDAEFEFSSPDADAASFECKLDGASFTACTSPKSYTGLSDGQHVFSVRALDNAGNPDPSPATFTWTVDTTGPTVSIDDTPADPSNSSNATFEFSSNEPGSTFQCKIDGNGSPCTSPQTYTGLNEGTHTFEVQATDPAGNPGPAASFTWDIDLTVPDTIIDTKPPALSISSTGNFTFHANQAGSTFACKLDAGAFLPCTSPKQYTSLSQGSHTVEVRATDPAGNDDPTPATWTWVVDGVPPTVTIQTGPSGPTPSPNPSFTFTTNDGTATLECKLDGGAFAACSSPKSYTGVAEGQHTFTVRATDAAGNAGADSRTFVVDQGPPDTTITQKPAASTGSTSAQFAFTSTEPGSTFECKLNGGAFAACSSPKSYTGLAEGTTYTFEVRAIDAAGSTDATPATHTWTVTRAAAPPAPASGGPAPAIVPLRGKVKTKGRMQVASLTCQAACTVTSAKGTIRVGGQTSDVTVIVPSSVPAGGSVPLRLQVTGNVRSGLRRFGRGVITLEVTVTGADGQSATLTKTIKVRGRGRAK